MAMQYRKFGRLDWKPSALGFGCMRLPTTDGNPMSGNIDEKLALKMIRHAIDEGVNYVDTAYPYHGGQSEAVVGKALKDGYREKVRLATKCPVWAITKPEEFDKYLDEQLQKLQTDHIDFYLFHGLEKSRWDTIVKLELVKRAEKAIKAGKIRYIGFSFHDKFDTFKTIIDSYDKWTFCQIQYNYMDIENQAGTKGLKYAASKGLAVVIMEPILGGRLANPPAPVRKILQGYDKNRTPSDWALQWVWSQPEVSVVLSGMSNLTQVEGNLVSASKSGYGKMTPEELKVLDRVRIKYRENVPIGCTKCGYCMPCPNGVNIPRNFELYNDGFIHEDPRTARGMYQRFLPEPQRAGSCAECHTCEEKCPQKLPISELMKKVKAVLGDNKPYPSSSDADAK